MRNNELEPNEVKIVLGAIGIIIAVILAGNLLWAEIIHNNWRCAFTQCRILTN